MENEDEKKKVLKHQPRKGSLEEQNNYNKWQVKIQ
jgi:hypothetical protein